MMWRLRSERMGARGRCPCGGVGVVRRVHAEEARSVQIWHCGAVVEGERGRGAHGLGWWTREALGPWARAVFRRIDYSVVCSWADVKS
jgi:hypothetical protein